MNRLPYVHLLIAVLLLAGSAAGQSEETKAEAAAVSGEIYPVAIFPFSRTRQGSKGPWQQGD